VESPKGLHSNRLQPSVIFVGRGRSLPLVGCPLMGSTLVGFSLAHKYQTRVEVNGIGKRVSLIRYGYNYSLKKFHSTGH